MIIAAEKSAGQNSAYRHLNMKGAFGKRGRPSLFLRLSKPGPTHEVAERPAAEFGRGRTIVRQEYEESGHVPRPRRHQQVDRVFCDLPSLAKNHPARPP